MKITKKRLNEIINEELEKYRLNEEGEDPDLSEEERPIMGADLNGLMGAKIVDIVDRRSGSGRVRLILDNGGKFDIYDGVWYIEPGDEDLTEELNSFIDSLFEDKKSE